MKACLARFDADVREYTTAPAMEDVAEVVRALGYERVDVYGVSYGATAAQYLLALHPELVRTVILDGGTLLDVPIFELWAPKRGALAPVDHLTLRDSRRAARGCTRASVGRCSR